MIVNATVRCWLKFKKSVCPPPSSSIALRGAYDSNPVRFLVSQQNILLWRAKIVIIHPLCVRLNSERIVSGRRRGGAHYIRAVSPAALIYIIIVLLCPVAFRVRLRGTGLTCNVGAVKISLFEMMRGRRKATTRRRRRHCLLWHYIALFYIIIVYSFD